MHRVELSTVEGVRWLPDVPNGVGALVLAGSSGRVDEARTELLAAHGVMAESIRWFGGAQQHDGPWEVPLELFFDRVDALAQECSRVLVLGSSFGAEAALLTGAQHPAVDAVVAFAPSDVVWAGVCSDGRVTSHWTLDGAPLPYVPFDDDWTPDSEVPAYVGLYEASRLRHSARLADAAIPVEGIRDLVLVAGAADAVWPAVTMSRAIEERRRSHQLETVVIVDPEAGHARCCRVSRLSGVGIGCSAEEQSQPIDGSVPPPGPRSAPCWTGSADLDTASAGASAGSITYCWALRRRSPDATSRLTSSREVTGSAPSAITWS